MSTTKHAMKALGSLRRASEGIVEGGNKTVLEKFRPQRDRLQEIIHGLSKLRHLASSRHVPLRVFADTRPARSHRLHAHYSVRFFGSMATSIASSDQLRRGTIGHYAY